MASRPHWGLGLGCTLLSNVVISLALNCQKLAHLQLQAKARAGGAPDEHTPLRAPARPRSYVRSRLWWLGLLLMALGETGNFVCTYSG